MQAAGGVQSKETFRRKRHGRLTCCFSIGIVEMQAAGGVQSKEIFRRQQHGRPTCLFFHRNCQYATSRRCPE